MVTQRQVGLGLGGASVGLIAGEATQQANERDVLTREQTDALAGGVGLGAVGLGGAAALTGYPNEAAGLVGFGIGTLGWSIARRSGLAPRLVVRLPSEVNLAGPIISGAIFSAVGLAAITLTGRRLAV